MSTFHAAALSKELRAALDTITSDQHWIESTRPLKSGQPVQIIEPVRPTQPVETARSASKRSLFSRGSQQHQIPTARVLSPSPLLSPAHQVGATYESTKFPAVLRERFEEQNAKCLELIAATDAYALAWRRLEMPNHSLYKAKGELVSALDELKQINDKTLFDLRRSLETSLQKYGRVVSRHKQAKYTSAYYEALYSCSLRFDDKIHHDESEASNSRSNECDLKGRHDCGHYYCFHHPFGPWSSGWLFGDKDTGVRLSRIRFATSVAQFLAIALQHAKKSASGFDIEDDDAITVEWHKQIEAVERLNEASLTLRSDERSNHVRAESSHFFDEIVLSHDDPLPLTAFVSRYLEISDVDQDNDETEPWSHTHSNKAMVHNHNDAGTSDDMLLITNLLISTRGHDNKHNAHLLERLDNLRRAHEELMEQASDLVSEMVNTDIQNNSYGSIATDSDATAALNDVVRNYISRSSGKASMISDQYPQNHPYGHFATEDERGAGPSSLPGSSDGLRSPYRLQPFDGDESARTAHRSLKSGLEQAKLDSALSDHNVIAEEEAPPPYTPNCDSKEASQPAAKSSASAPTSAFTSEQQPRGHSSRSASVRSSIQTVRTQPNSTNTTSEDVPIISHATGVLFSEYFERIAENQKTT